MIKISGEFDDGDDEYGADYDSNDVDPEIDPEISNDNDQDNDPDNISESGEEYNPFECPDYDNPDPEYNPFECPDYGNKEEIEDEGDEYPTGEEQNEFSERSSAEIYENLSEKEENIDQNVEEYSKPEANQQEERVADLDSENHDHKPEITSSVETENIGTEQSTITFQQQSQEQRREEIQEGEKEYKQDPENIPEQEQEDNVDNIELIDPEDNPSKPVESSEVLNIRKELEEMNLPPEPENEPLNEQMLESVPEQDPEEENLSKFILDAEKMEFLGEYVSSHKEMEVEILEEEMEELFNKYEEKGLEQEQGLDTSYELKQENHQEQQELEEIFEGAYTQEQEEKVNLEIEQAQEQDEKEDIKEFSHPKIKENKQEFSQEIEQSNRKSQEIEQKVMQEVHLNVVQEEIQEQIEKQKDQTLKKSAILLEERYREEAGRRPIYAGKETRGFIEWKEHLKEQEEKQEEKNNLLQEKKKEIKEQSIEIRESKEEWAQYLEHNIKEAEFSEEIKSELNELLERYEQLRKILENLKNKEISEEEFEKEVKEFEYLLIEKRFITRPLFMNFDWFRRYYNGMIKKAGKRVAHLYISKKTREFLSCISGKAEHLKSLRNSQENGEKFREFLEKSFQIKEKWALLLNNLIHETPNKEISKEVKEELESVIKMYCEIRAILFNKNILEKDKEKLIQERFEKCSPRFFELFEILKRFLGIYGNYSRTWMEQSLILEGKKTIKLLSQKIGNIKKKNSIDQILNEKLPSNQNFKEIIRQNLYKSIELNVKDKSKIIKIIQNEKFDEKNNVKLTNILSKLSKEELNSLLGEDFKKYSQTYTKNRSHFNEIKKIIILNFLDKKIKEQDKEDSYFVQSIKPKEKSKIKIPHFKQKIVEHLKHLIDLIDGTTEQKEFIQVKSLEILDEFISRAQNNEFIIPKNANLEKIAATIIFTVTLSNKNMPKITRKKITELTNINIKSPSDISNYYKKYFGQLYPRTEFRFTSYPGFNNIRNIISLYLFGLIKDTEIKTFKLVLSLKGNILNGINLPKLLTQKDISILHEMVTLYQDTFIRYFSDLVELVKQIIISSMFYKKISAHLVIKYIAESLIERGINLLKKPRQFYYAVIEIYDFLYQHFSDFLPLRSYVQKNLSKKEREKEQEEYEKIVGTKIKLYLIKNIYNGKYFKDGKAKCPECLKEGLIKNTDISRLEALEFHHNTNKNQNQFTVDNLYNMFTKNQANPHFFEELISLMESEKVILICRNHHHMLHDSYFNYFNYLINWENLFSLPAELIHLLIRTSVENHRLTRNLPIKSKKEIRRRIKSYIKKRYIIERIYGEFCPTCVEFNTKKHLSAFHFNHEDKKTKNIEASNLYSLHSCSEIVKILEQERGGYICSNCHTVIHYEKFHLLDEIYENKNVVKRILEDYNSVSKNFTIIHYNSALVGNPLKKTFKITESIERYLTAIYEITKSGYDVTVYTLAEYLKISSSSISNYFYRKKNVITQYIDIIARRPTKYVLNKYGGEIISLIYHFRDYYNSL